MSGRRPVLAAVDDSPAAVAVVGQAAALAVRENRQLLVLTVRPASAGYPAVEAGPGGAGLLRMNGVDSAGGAGDSPLGGQPIGPRGSAASRRIPGPRRGRTERIPADPTTVEVGDLVRVDGDAAAITLLVVDPVEATYVEQAWLLADGAPGGGRRVDVLPADTGLGFALLGRRVGDRVSVPPGGPGRRPRTLRVLHCRRLRPTDLAAAPRHRQPDHRKGPHRAPRADVAG